jgi:HK97 family phage major capsid protein
MLAESMTVPRSLRPGLWYTPNMAAIGSTSRAADRTATEIDFTPRSALHINYADTYSRNMFARTGRHLEAPHIGELVFAALKVRTEFDDRMRRRYANFLNDAMVDITSVRRTDSGISGSTGGFAIPVGVSDFIADRAREVVTPLSLADWQVSPPHQRERVIPFSYEASQSNALGGYVATWGTSETTMPTPVDGQITPCKLIHDRLVVLTKLSRDIMEDARSIGQFVATQAVTAIREALVGAMIGNSAYNTNQPCVVGAANGPATVAATRGSGGTISVGDPALMWQALSEGCQQSPRTAWHCNGNSLGTILGLAAATTAQPAISIPAQYSPFQGMFSTIFNHALIPTRQCAAIGSPGDLILAAWDQYVLSFIPLGRTGTPLEFDFVFDPDLRTQGLYGMPPTAVESRASAEYAFQNDLVYLAFKARVAGNWAWPNTATGGNSTAVGPCVIL